MRDVASLLMCMQRKPFELSRSRVLLCLTPTHFCHMGCYPQPWWSVLQQRESHSILFLHIPPLGVSQGTPKKHTCCSQGQKGKNTLNPSAFPAAPLGNFVLEYKESTESSAWLSWGESSHQPAASPGKLPALRTGCSWLLNAAAAGG